MGSMKRALVRDAGIGSEISVERARAGAAND
jgi:hypothetical protein